MLTASCHCGAVIVTVPRRPRSVTECNCSLCRRYGALWAYYRTASVHVAARREAIDEYVWGQKMLKFVRCKSCGCVVCEIGVEPNDYMGVNARMFDPSVLAKAALRHRDGASR